MNPNRGLGPNLLSMSTVQAVNMLLPVITFPYLVRVLGLEQFGLINYALALVSFFIVFVDFGFNLTGTRDVAVARDDRRALSVLFSTRWIAQALLLLAAAVVFLVLVLQITRLQRDWLIYALTFGLVPATVLLPTWYFQGTEQFKLLAKLQLASRGLYALGIFTLVRSPADTWLVPLLNSGTGMLIALVATWRLFARDGLQFAWPGLSRTLKSLREGLSIFSSSFAVTAYNYSALLILGAVASDRMVGQFAAIDKILLVFRTALSAFFSVTFPRTCQLAPDGTPASAQFLRGLFRLLLPALLALSVLLVAFASPVLQLAIGRSDPELVELLSWMAWILVFLGVNQPSYQQLLAHRRNRTFTAILVVAAAGSIALNLLLAPAYGALGTAWSVLFAEIAIALGLLYATEIRHRDLAVWRRSVT
jgi:PST family polysaccharide transporter